MALATWPQGKTIAGKPYSELVDKELGAAGQVIANNTTADLFVMPWWSGGYSKCFMQIPLLLAAGGPVQLLAEPLASNGASLLAPGLGFELLTGAALVGGDNYLLLNFDDGILPGSYSIVTIAGLAPAVGLTINPVWTKAPMLKFQLNNTSGGNVTTLAGFRIFLGS